MNIASLFAKLGLQVDAAAWAKGDARLAQMRETAETTMGRVATIWRDTQGRLRYENGRFVAEGSADMKAWEQANLNGAERTKKAWGRALGGIRAGFDALKKVVLYGGVAAYGLKRVTDMGDAYNGAASRVRQLTDDTERQTKINDALFASAQATGTLFTDVAQVYQQVGKAAVDSGRSLEAGVKIVDTINKALKASGATSEGGAQALRQLSQALGSGTLRGEEFNSVIEQAPYLIDIIAKSMGKTRGEMRKMAEAGAITSKQILKALEGQAGAVDAAYNKRIPQAGEAWTRMRNTIEKSIGTVLQSKDVMSGLQSVIAGLTAVLVGAIQALGTIASFLAKHPALVKGIIVAIVALTGAFVAMKVAAFLAWTAALGPVALLAAGIAGAIALFVAFGGKLTALADAVAELFGGIVDVVKGAFTGLINFVIGKVNWLIRKTNWLIKQMNRLPGIDIDTIGEIERIGSTAKGQRPALSGPARDIALRTPTVDAAGRAKWDPAAADPWLMPTRRVPKPARNITISGNSTVIQVNSPATDPEAVASLVEKKNREFWDNQMRDALAGTGGAEDDEA